MADNGVRTYKIVINGLTESVKAVDALSDSLQFLDKKIKEMESRSVNISSTSSGSNAKSLQTEDTLLKQIQKTEQEIVNARREEYNQLLADKDLLKQTKDLAEQRAASERLAASNYANTMQGMKQELADIKKVMNTTDIDSDNFKQMTARAGELTGKLKELEQSYGTFSRNVGNYPKEMANGFNGIKIAVADTVHEFDNAKQALKTLQGELRTLQVKKDQGMLLSDEELKRFEELPSVVAQLKSSIQDAGKPMDNLMDSMQSVVAIMQSTKGISAFFGFDDGNIERSIQKLVGLQNAMKGFQTINKQLQSQEGIGKLFGPLSKSIDVATTKLLVFNRALLGTGKVSKIAAAGIKLFGKALKLAISGGILIAVDLLVEKLMDLVESFKKVDKAAEDTKKVEEEMAKSYAEGTAKIQSYITKLKNFNGSKEQEKKIVKELNSELGNSLGTYDSISKWYDVLIKKGSKYIEMLQMQAKAQAALNNYVEALQNEQKVKNMSNEDYSSWYDGFTTFLFGAKATEKRKNKARVSAIQVATAHTQTAKEEMEKGQKELQNFMEKNKMGDYSDQIKSGGTKTKAAVKKEEVDLTSLRLKLMKDGLNKTLMQLDEEKRQTINKIKQNGKNVQNLIKEVEESYYQLRLKAIDEYLKKLDEEIEEYSKKIAAEKFEINTKEVEYQINALDELIRKATEDSAPQIKTLTSKVEYQTEAKGIDKDRLFTAAMFDAKKIKAVNEKGIEEFRKFIDENYADLIADIKEKNKNLNDEAVYSIIDENLEYELKKELDVVRKYGYQEEASLTTSFANRLRAERKYEYEYLEGVKKHLTEIKGLQEKEANDEYNRLYEEEDKKYSATTKSLKDRKQSIEEGLKAIEKVTVNAGKKMTDEEQKKYDKLKKKLEETNKQLDDELVLHGEKQGQIMTDYKEKQVKIENDYNQRIESTQKKYYDSQLSNYRDFLSKMNNETSKQPVYDKYGLGIINLKKTKENYKEILKAAEYTLSEISADRDNLNRDFQNGLLSPDEYNSTLNQLNDLETETKNTAETVGNNLKDVGTEWWGSINQWIQNIGSTITSVMSSLSEITSNLYDEQISQQEKYIDEYEKLLDKQKDITQKYADDVNSIEDELKTARGDRRQQLIDQLNAEMAAQRDSLAQEKKIEKEKEKAEQKKKKLEHDQAVAEKKMSIWQAAINAAMAVSMAAVNHWPLPAIPMMSMAAAVGAAQLAAVMSKPIPTYATGGVIEGKSHAQGGVKVLGGRAEVEGREFITNKVTTQENVDLMYYINDKKRKLNLDDFIDFYSSGAVRKNIQSVKTRFADGGQIPVLSNSIDINDRMITAMEDYSNRPVVVEVTEILNKADSVRNVQVMAGLTDASSI